MKKLLPLLFIIPNLVMGEEIYFSSCFHNMTKSKNEWAAKRYYDICVDYYSTNTEENSRRNICMGLAAQKQTSYAAKEYYAWCLEDQK